jgi:membrane protein YqaA with SNARE-associated domain
LILENYGDICIAILGYADIDGYLQIFMLEGLEHLGYFGLFLASFLAATVLPFSSEVVFGAVIAAGLDVWTCIIVATIGNTMGGMTCYWLGSLGKVEWVEKYLKIKHEQVEKMQKWLKGKGAITAFFSFLPVVGDPLAVALGFMRANVWLVLIFMTLGKFSRYLVIGIGLERILGIM